MASPIGLAVAFVGFLLIIASGWTRNASVFGASVFVGIPALVYGLRMLLGG